MTIECKSCSMHEQCICETSADECEIRKQSYNKAIDDFIEVIDKEDRKEPLILDMLVVEEIAERLKREFNK